jgi:fumarate reductase subunit D
MDTFALLGSAAGLGLLAGIRLYFTVFALGLAIRMGWFEPNASMSHLHVLAQSPILFTSGALFLAEFVADKIPWFDSMWDAVHTFIRPVGAAALGITALGNFDPSTATLIGLVSGGAAFTGHASKAATRVAVNHSPEPFSNWLLSFAEDLIVPFGLWIVMEHPIIAAVLATMFIVAFLLIARLILRLFRGIFRRQHRVAA